MARPLLTLLDIHLRQWIGARGFAMVVVAALFPLFLTGAWMGTHQGDLSAASVAWSPKDPVEGDNLTVTGTVRNLGGGVGAFNASLSVGRVFGNTLRADASETTTVQALDGGATRDVTLTWQARPGVYWALLYADSDDTLGEIEEFNNQKAQPLVVRYKEPAADQGPRAPGNLTGDAAASGVADLQVASLTLPPDLAPARTSTFRATFNNLGPAEANATLHLRVGRVFAGQLLPAAQTQENVTLEAGGARTVEVPWAAQEGAFWVEAWANATGAARDPAEANNHQARGFAVQPVLPADATPPAPPEKLTIKDFYLRILSVLHLRILLPFIGLFYAAGVLADERERGSLPYLLTRPIGRWTIPVAKFLASYLVAAAAVVLGLVLTFALLFGTPQGDVGFLTTPILASLVALFVYGGFFVLLGVLVDRPYLVGVAFVIGWETVAGIFVPWVRNLTIGTHIVNAINAWPLDRGVQLVPPSEEGLRALVLVVGAGAAFLAASVVAIRRREFDV